MPSGNPPTAVADYFSVHQSVTLYDSPLANDSDPENDALTPSIVDDPTHGVASFDFYGNLLYVPTPGYVGSDSLTYRVHDGSNCSNTVAINISVTNTAPVAVTDTYSTHHDVPLYVSPMSNDSDADSDVLAPSIVDDPTHGVASFDFYGNLLYVPTAGYVGSDSLTYRIFDGAEYSDPVTINISVTNTIPVAVTDSYSTHHDVSLYVSPMSNDSDSDSDVLAPSIVDDPTHGVASFDFYGNLLYVPTAGYVGSDSLTYRIFDGAEYSDPVTINISVTNTIPVAVTDSYSTHHDVSLYVSPLSNDSDADNDVLAPSIVDDPTHGVASFDFYGNLLYVPTPGYVGSDSLTYRIFDGAEYSDPVTINISVTNTAPVIGSLLLDNANPKTNDILTVQVIDALDDENDLISFTYIWSVNGNVVQTTTTTNVSDSLDLSQSGFGDKGDVVNVIVAPFDNSNTGNTVNTSANVVNSAPVATALAFSMPHDTMATDIPFASDADGDELEYVVTSNPSHGLAIQGQDGKLEYYPDPGWAGTDTFVIFASDGSGDSSAVSITVSVTNMVPVAAGESFFVERDHAITAIYLNAYLTDADGDQLQAIVGTPTYGVLVPNGDSTYNYIPNESFTGTDSFTIQANDGAADSNVATFTITVTAYAPPNADGSYSVLHGHSLSTIDFSVNDNDALGDPTQIVIESGPTYGTLTPNGDGTYRYVAPLDFVGSDTVTISANGGSQVVVTINVTDIAPVAKDVFFSLEAYNQAYSNVEFLANATDSDGDALTIEIISGPQYGSLDFNSTTGRYDYHANTSYLGRDNFTVRYFDGATYSQSVYVDILVYDDTTNFATDSYVQGFGALVGADFNGLPTGMGIRQGNINDCWFVAAAVGLAEAVPNALAARMGANQTPIIVDLGPDAGGERYRVTFPGRSSVTFTFMPGLAGRNFVDPENPENTMTLSTSTNNNGDWSAILEQAWAYRNASAANTTWAQDIKEVLDHQSLGIMGIRALTGLPGLANHFSVTPIETTRQDLIDSFNAGIIVTASAKDGDEHGLISNHEYTVLGFNAATNMVHLRNPHGFTAAWGESVFIPAPSNQLGGGGSITIRRPPLGAGGAADFWISLTNFNDWFQGANYER